MRMAQRMSRQLNGFKYSRKAFDEKIEIMIRTERIAFALAMARISKDS